jgi:hypothetical protein
MTLCPCVCEPFTLSQNKKDDGFQMKLLKITSNSFAKCNIRTWGRRGTLIDYWWESHRERDH